MGTVSDAFIVAFTAPSTLLALFGGAVGTFIPIYSLEKTDKKAFTNNVLTCLLAAGLLFSVIFTIFPQALALLFASQFDPETFELTADFLRIMVWCAVPVLMSGVLASFLQIKKAFFMSAIGTIPMNVFVISTILLSRPTDSLWLMGAGFTIGHTVVLCMFLYFAKRKGHAFRPHFNLKMPEMREMLILAAPVLMSTAFMEIRLIIEKNFASSLPSGSVSALSYSNRVINVLISIISGSVATVLFPRMSELAGTGEIRLLKNTVVGCTKRLFPLLLPTSAGIFILARPIVWIIFERGSFTPEDTTRTAECMSMYALMILPASLNPLIIRAFYAIRDTKWPAAISIMQIGIHVPLNILLIGPLQHMGLALTTSIVFFVAFALYILILRKKLGSLGLKSQLKEFGKSVLATLVMSVAVWFGQSHMPLMSGGTTQGIALTGGLIIAGAGFYLLLMTAMRAEFVEENWRYAWGVFGRRKRV